MFSASVLFLKTAFIRLKTFDKLRIALYNLSMVVDFHTHCYKPLLAKKATSLIPPGSPYGPYYDGTAEGLIKSMKESGVDYSVVLNIANSPSSVRAVNDYAIELLEFDNLIPFGSVHPGYNDIEGEILRLKEHGIKGLKFHPYYQHCELCSKDSYRAYELGAKHDMIMLFHGGHDLMVPGENSTPRLLRKLYDDFRGAKFVFAHLGGWGLWDECFKLLVGQDVYLDTSFAFMFLSHEQIEFVLSNHDNKKLLFGTDGPWTNSKNELNQTKQLSTPYLNDILSGNAMKLLGM